MAKNCDSEGSTGVSCVVVEHPFLTIRRLLRAPVNIKPVAVPVPGASNDTFELIVTRLSLSAPHWHRLRLDFITFTMSAQVAVPDVVNVDLHRPAVMSSISSDDSITSQPPLHALGCPPRNPSYVRLDDSSSRSGFLERLPHANARLDAR